jgi:hypothetical protein
VKRIRIQKPRARRERPGHEALPPDPRDPDIVRAKALARAGNPRRRVTGRAATVPRPADASGTTPSGLATDGLPGASRVPSSAAGRVEMTGWARAA